MSTLSECHHRSGFLAPGRLSASTIAGSPTCPRTIPSDCCGANAPYVASARSWNETR